jgi:hypothetical protein
LELKRAVEAFEDDLDDPVAIALEHAGTECL